MTDVAINSAQDFAEARKAILHSHESLAQVANYCEDNYMKAKSEDRRTALEETKNYTTQALASVAYQINILATNFLQQLDSHAVKAGHMESDVQALVQQVELKKEKPIRKDFVDKITGEKEWSDFEKKEKTNVGWKILRPKNLERIVRYTRKAIDYKALDDIGLGVIITEGETRKPAMPNRNRSVKTKNVVPHNLHFVEPPKAPENHADKENDPTIANGEVKCKDTEQKDNHTPESPVNTIPQIDLLPPDSPTLPRLSTHQPIRRSYVIDEDELPPFLEPPSINDNRESMWSLPPPPEEFLYVPSNNSEDGSRDKHTSLPPPPDDLSLPPPPSDLLLPPPPDDL